jgi:G3E family GTPase
MLSVWYFLMNLRLDHLPIFVQNMIYCDLLTGFLGSGKTTILNRLLKNVDARQFAVIVNEFGDVGLDQLVFNQVSENVYLLDSGCLCCTITHSLRETLMEILEVAKRTALFELNKVVIESSGLADPLPTLHALIGDAVLKPYFRLGSVVTTIDALQGLDQLRVYPESIRQVMVADHLVMTKLDLVDENILNELKERVLEINPLVTPIDSGQIQAIKLIFQEKQNSSLQFLKGMTKPIEGLKSALNLNVTRAFSRVTDHTKNTQSWSRFIDFNPTWVGLSSWWNIIKNEYDTKLLRTKGLVTIQECSKIVMIHGVGTYFHSPVTLDSWPDSDPRGRLVCIGVGLNSDFLDASLRALTLQDSYAKPNTLAELSQLLN